MTRKILVSAYACEPGKGSEQGVGWNWVLQLAECGHVTVITRSNNQPVIEAVMPEGSDDRISISYYDPPNAITRLKQGEKRLYLYYFFWQLGAFFLARRLQAKQNFDYVIALTFGSIWMPTFMQFLKVPFIWGPIGGGEAVPIALLEALSPRAQFMQRLRYFLFKILRFNPMIQHCFYRASAILARTEDTAKLIPQKYQKKTATVLETAVSADLLEELDTGDKSPESGPFHVIYTGRLIGLKNVASALHSVAYCIKQGIEMKFTIIGDGPERVALQELAQSLGISKNVIFQGKVPRETVISELKEADLYLFPSLKEGGVWSLMEAMSASLPVICVETSGMALITDHTCARRIPPTELRHLRKQMGQALAELALDRQKSCEMGQAGRERIVTHFQWSQKSEEMMRLFNRLEAGALKQNSDAPT